MTVQSVNSETVGLYEQFEILVSLENASYSNSYDPDQIDLRVIFTAPSGRQWEIFGFYDNYLAQKKWKVRFSPNEIGEWRYVLRATDADGMGESEEFQFLAVASDHHGWLRVSPDNPHYLIYDDGTSFYGVGAYYPWGVNNGSSGLGLLEDSGANLFGYWNIMYGGEGNIIESLTSGLGRYDQPKCGRIDKILQWAEARGLKMMFAIWPHDLLSNTVWAHQWHKNPYNTITSVEDFYGSETAWEYQEKQYRYIIARWGYSRSMGIWEIVNEINGTDGWVAGRHKEATQWVQKAHDYLTANDPYGRPTTASKSGGLYWTDGYAIVDLPNVHLYETGWLGLYGGNPIRSSLWTYQQVTRQLWEDFEKPAIMGEAGYRNTYGNFPVGSDEYLAVYHNALWVSWANGLAATPVWWDMGSRDIMNSRVMQQMLYFSNFVHSIDYAHYKFSHTEVFVPDCDAFAMKGDVIAFGWLREHYGNDVSGKMFEISGLPDTSYTIQWYDPWAGQVVETHIRPSVNGTLTDLLPALSPGRPDVAFLIRPTEVGEIPAKLDLIVSPRKLLNDGQSKATITCYILDERNRFCSRSNNRITFSLEGPGSLLGNFEVDAFNGIAMIELQSDNNIGTSIIHASSPGLFSDSVEVRITNRLLIDDFEKYSTNSSLRSAWKVRSGTHANIALEGLYVGEGQQALKTSYAIGNGSPPYAGFFKSLGGDYTGVQFLHFWLKPDGSGRDLAILIHESGSRYWQYNIQLDMTNVKILDIPLNAFVANDGAMEMDLTALSEISFNVLKGSGDMGTGVLFIDDVAFLTSLTTKVRENPSENFFSQCVLYPSYPNPFNRSTVIRYSLPRREHVTISIFNTRGRLVKTLVDSVQKAGEHEIHWYAQHVATGIYFYRLQTGNFSVVEKCLLIK